MINTQKIFDKTIQEIAEVVKLINEDGEDVDSKIISDMNDDISDLHATLFDGNNDFVELKYADVRNIASKRVIVKCGGVYLDTVEEDRPMKNDKVNINRYIVYK